MKILMMTSYNRPSNYLNKYDLGNFILLCNNYVNIKVCILNDKNIIIEIYESSVR